MSSICGIYCLTNTELLEKNLPKMVASLNHWNADRIGYCNEETVSFAHLLLYNTPESLNEQQPLKDSTTSQVITADVRLDNRKTLCKQLHIAKPQRQKITDPELILKAYQAWGQSCPEKLLGDFAFAIWDPKEQYIFCARDHMGCKPLYYYIDNQQFIFSTEVKSINELADTKTEIDEYWLAYSLSLLKPDFESTLYKNIKALAPAHCMVVKNNQVLTRRYWYLDPTQTINLANEQEYSEALVEHMQQAVQCRLRSHYPIGSELSGGLDSSFVTALAAESVKDRLHTFSHVQSAADKKIYFPYEDEHQYIELLCDSLKLPHKQRHLITREGQGAFSAIERELLLHGGPGLPTQTLYANGIFESAANNGIRSLLTGFGGDHLVSSYGDGYQQDLLLQNQWSVLKKELLAKASNNKGRAFRSLLRLILEVYFPRLFNKIQKARGKPTLNNNWQFRQQHLCINHDFATQYGLPQHFNRLSLHPLVGSVRERELHKITNPTLTNRLENGGLFASSYGIEYRHPLIDIRLLEFCLALPAKMKQQQGIRRYLFRKSMQGFVPEPIQHREDKARHSVPTAVSQFDHDRPQLLKAFQDIPVDSLVNKYIDVKKIIDYLQQFDKTCQPAIPFRAVAFAFMVSASINNKD